MRYPLEPLVQGPEMTTAKVGSHLLINQYTIVLNQKNSHDKQLLRNSLRKIRAEIDADARQIAETKLLKRLHKMPHFAEHECIGAYLNLEHEFPTGQIIKSLQKSGKTIACPAITDTKKRLMEFRQLTGNLQKQAFGIMVPAKSNKKIAANKLDIILLPLLGFDLNGNRLGMGGGYYDQLLSFKNDNSNNTEKPILIGIGFEAQLCHEITNDPWDVKLDAIITESRTTIFNSALT